MQNKKIQPDTPGRKLLRSVRKRRLKTIIILPSLVTILNGLCGFGAIVFAGKAVSDPETAIAYSTQGIPYFAIAGYLILLAMIFDVLDGRLARMSQSTSSFGGQLDSLCDMISFGVAPAYLMVKILEHKLAQSAYSDSASAALFNRFVWITAAAYISCAAIRLARFNVENEKDESSHMSFLGLPTPAAAGALISLVLFYQQVLPDITSVGSTVYTIGEYALVYSLPFVLLATASLMVSRIRYPHVVNQYVKGKKPFSHLLWLLTALGVIVIWKFQVALVFFFCGFAVLGFARWLHKVLRRQLGTAEQQQFTAQTATQSGQDSPF